MNRTSFNPSHLVAAINDKNRQIQRYTDAHNKLIFAMKSIAQQRNLDEFLEKWNEVFSLNSNVDENEISIMLEDLLIALCEKVRTDSKTNTLFAVISLQSLDFNDETNWFEVGSTRTVGIFSSKEEAINVVKNNSSDICETVYDYVLIEELEQGLYPEVISQEMYKVKDKTTQDDNGDIRYNHDLTYERIEIPEEFPEYAFSVG